MFIDKDKTKKMLAFVEDEHFRYRRDPHAKPGKNELKLTSDFIMNLHARQTPLLRQMKDDFITFFRKCMWVRFKKGRNGRKQIVFGLDGSGENSEKDESFVINAGDNTIKVIAGTERGLLHASHYLERKAALRMGPFIKKGRIEKKPLFNTRISQTIFCLPEEDIRYPIMLTDKYMSLMSHFGINGIFIYTVLWDYCKNSSIPELNTKNYKRNITTLRKFCQRAGRHGIDIYLHMNTRTFSPDSEVFRKRLDIRGSRLNLMSDVVKTAQYNLCSSNRDVQNCYNETFENIFREVPGLGGTIIIVGGECFLHCWTRPKPPLKGGTSCPHCAGRNPSKDVARMVNGIAKSVHRVSPSAKVFVWPYSAFTWSGKDFAQEEFIDYLNKDISFLSNFDTPYTCKVGRAEAKLIDYNILNIGPSEQFKKQSKALVKKGMPHYAKIESSTDPALFFLPYIPVHCRWFKRYKKLIKNKVPGFLSKWRFYGFTGSIPEELLSEMTWDKDAKAGETLYKIARRDFGNVSLKILDGWRKLSSAWEKIPFSHLLFGERQFYMKGPLYLGPAHPMIFDVQKRYNLSKKFFTIRGDAGELISNKELAEIERGAPPRYSSDLLFTYPFSPVLVESRMKKTIKEWDEGIKILTQALGRKPTKRAVMELDICKAVSCHLHSGYNITRFYRIREEFFSGTGSEKILNEKIELLTKVLNDEIENAKSILPILTRDVRIGYGHCYGQVYDREMIEEKIRQCIYVRDDELSELKFGILFHIYGKYVFEDEE